MGDEEKFVSFLKNKGTTLGEPSGKYHLLVPFSRSENGLDATSLNVEEDTTSTNKQSLNQNKHGHMEMLFFLLRRTY
jgi:hypothetical protein